MEAFEVVDGSRVLVFVGSLLGESTSWTPGKQRWTEIRIYVTEGESFVVAGIGRSVLPGERDRCWAKECDSPGVVARSLGKGDKMPYVCRLALTRAWPMAFTG